MKRLRYLLPAVLLLLTGCSGPGKPLEAAFALQDEYAGASSVCVTALVTADYGDSVSRFTLRYEGTPDTGTLSVLEPDCVAGLRARVSREEGISLVWEDAELFAGALDPSGLSPVDCLPVLLGCWCDGPVTAAAFCSCMEEDALRVDFYVCDGVTAVSFFGREDHLPLLAELDAEGTAILTCQFQNVTISESK